MIRDIEFTEELDVAILSERRVVPPYGMRGGEPGAVGKTYWLKGIASSKNKNQANRDVPNGNGNGDVKDKPKTHTKIRLGGKNQVRMKAGDHIVLHTPGGGGYGVPGTVDERLDEEVYKKQVAVLGGGARANGSLAAMTAAAWSN
jgi:5-oxoprolinase (ATP-hydrolysing)